MEKFPMGRQLGDQVGEYLAKEHAKAGVVLHATRRVSEIKGDNNTASSVVLDDGTVLQADLVLVGAGVLPATKFLEGSGIALDQ
jgi:3-phenylpropionate/trans-cinnamate dioxygenase ferredoxin reductase component